MAGRKENLKALFSNTRSRVIILFTAALLLIAVVVGTIKLSSSSSSKSLATANLMHAPSGIQSVPGALDQTAQYANLQQEQNVQQAKAAQQKGGSAIPTIIRTQAFGNGVEAVGPQQGTGSAGFETLAREDDMGPQQSLWLQTLKDGNCSKDSVTKVVNQGASINDLKGACTCVQLKDDGYKLNDLQPVCSCKELKAAGYNAQQMKTVGYTADRLQQCGFSACELRNAGFSAKNMKDGGFSDGELKGAGFPTAEIDAADGLPKGITEEDVRKAGCKADALSHLRAEGVSAAAIQHISGCSAAQLKAAGYSSTDLPPGVTPASIKAAGCSADAIKKERFAGVKDDMIKKYGGCTDEQLKAAGVADDLPPGITPASIKAAGCSADAIEKERFAGVKDDMIKKYGGCTDAQLKAAGIADCSPASLLSAHALGISAGTIRQSLGCSAKQLLDAGYTPADLQKGGYTDAQLADAGFSPQGSTVAGFKNTNQPAAAPSAEMPLPSLAGQPTATKAESKEAANAKQLQEILKRQQGQMANQRYQQKIQQRTSAMTSAASQAADSWKTVPVQVYIGGTAAEKESEGTQGGVPGVGNIPSLTAAQPQMANGPASAQGLIKAGDVLFAVMDTSVNSDEPGPILATIVSGKLKGAKLIGSFNLPSNANKMVISFNTMSVPGAAKTTSISAYAIDPNTARTALSSRTNHHYLLRYGSLFAATFLEGFGNAFQSANTTITIGGFAQGTNTSISNGVGRSVLENAVIGLATLGKSWGQVAQQQFSTPVTVDVYSGTGIGVLFTQDLASL